MSTIWLAVVKTLADALTAASGVYGLLREFKDKKGRITGPGKKALGGIIIGLLLAIAMTVIDTRRSQQEECDHRNEVSDLKDQLDRAQHPLGNFKAHLSLAMPMSGGDYVSTANERLYKYLQGTLGKGTSGNDTGVMIDSKGLPHDLLNGAYSYSVPSIYVYRNKPCSQVKVSELSASDLELTLQGYDASSTSEVLEQASGHVIYPTKIIITSSHPPDGPLVAEKDLPLTVKHGSDAIISTRDLIGSTLVFTSTVDDRYFLEPLSLDLTAAKGYILHIPVGAFTILKDQFEFIRTDSFRDGPKYMTKASMYCYTFPRKRQVEPETTSC